MFLVIEGWSIPGEGAGLDSIEGPGLDSVDGIDLNDDWVEDSLLKVL